MSSMAAPYTLNISGGTFTQVHGDAHYHGFRGAPFPEIFLCKTYVFVN
jgi:hypothetical protein